MLETEFQSSGGLGPSLFLFFQTPGGVGDERLKRAGVGAGRLPGEYEQRPVAEAI